MTAPAVTLREALSDPKLLGSALPGETWATWRAVMLAQNGEELTPSETIAFDAVTGGRKPPLGRVDEAFYVIGRRGGKDTVSAVQSAYLATCVDWSAVLRRGERGILLNVGADKRQARVQRDYVQGVLESSPILSAMIERTTADEIHLNNGVTIEVRAASFRRLRGPTLIAAIATEVAFWYSDESANPDSEILNAVRPALATTGGPLIVISSPWTRRGVLWRAVEEEWSDQGDPRILVVRGPTREFNPSIPQKVVDRALARDSAAARSEWLGEFRSDVSALLEEKAIQAVLATGVREIPPQGKTDGRRPSYTASFDAATGAGADAAALAIAVKGDPAELVLTRRWKPPFDPRRIIHEAAGLCKTYGIQTVRTDRYAPGLVAAFFREAGLSTETMKSTTSENFLDLLSAIQAGRVRLLDDPALIAELRRLERRPGSGGREKISHPPSGHDDLAAAAAGALVGTWGKAQTSATWGRARATSDSGGFSRQERRDLLRQRQAFARSVRSPGSRPGPDLSRPLDVPIAPPSGHK